MLCIESETVALDFDLAASYALLEFDNKREAQRLKASKQMMKEAISEQVFGAAPPAPENEPDFDDIDDDDVL